MMGKGSSKTSTKVLPLIPLASPLALLPGTTLKIPITNRSDVAAILAKIYSISPTAKPDAAITVACVPLNSNTLGPDGQLLIEDGHQGEKTVYESDPMQATKKDIFAYACVAKVSGVQGRRQGDLSLVVEGLERVQVVDVVQERPYFEGELMAVEEYSTYYQRLNSPWMATNKHSRHCECRSFEPVQPPQAAVARTARPRPPVGHSTAHSTSHTLPYRCSEA